MAKQLKVWNGRGHGIYDNGYSMYVAAYSKKQASELLGQACRTRIGVNEISEYYSQCWGNPMQDIEPTEPCVYAGRNYGTHKPFRVI